MIYKPGDRIRLCVYKQGGHSWFHEAGQRGKLTDEYLVEGTMVGYHPSYDDILVLPDSIDESLRHSYGVSVTSSRLQDLQRDWVLIDNPSILLDKIVYTTVSECILELAEACAPMRKVTGAHCSNARCNEWNGYQTEGWTCRACKQDRYRFSL